MKKLTTFMMVILFVSNSITVFSQWVKIADYSGSPNDGCTSMVINGKAYVGGGNYQKDFYQYDPGTNSWSQKADIGGNENRAWPFSFTLNGKCYVGGGDTSDFTPAKDFWQYDPVGNTWTRKADFGGGNRDGCYSFVINNVAYVGGGFDGTNIHNDLWKYDDVLNSWTYIGCTALTPTIFALAFVINNKAYITTGSHDGTNGIKELWEYNPSGNTWTQKTDFPGLARAGASGFSVGNKGYLVGGDSAYSKSYTDFWSYNPANNTWTKLADNFPNAYTSWAASFFIGSDAYVGTGINSETFYGTKQFYKYHFNVTGITGSDEQNGSPEVYPVPAINYLVVSPAENEKISGIEIYDLRGKLIYNITTSTENPITINTSYFTGGMYILQVRDDKGIRIRRFVVK